MKVGLDSYTLTTMGLDPYQTMDFVHQNGFAGIQFAELRTFNPALDLVELKRIRAYGDRLGLYTHVSVTSPNPLTAKKLVEELVQNLTAEIEVAAACGWHELHASLGNPGERYSKQVPWKSQLSEVREVLMTLAPVLRATGSRINLEPHGDTTTFELIRIVEDVGADIAGICLDTANVLCFAEDPVEAAFRAAPYTHMTHSKDAIVYFSDNGYTRQGRPPGRGVLEWEKILPILAHFSPDLTLSIEDHKFLYEIPIFRRNWHEEQHDLSRRELSRVVELAWETQKKIISNELPDPKIFEAIPFQDERMERISFGRDYLNGLLKKLRLES